MLFFSSPVSKESRWLATSSRSAFENSSLMVAMCIISSSLKASASPLTLPSSSGCSNDPCITSLPSDSESPAKLDFRDRSSDCGQRGTLRSCRCCSSSSSATFFFAFSSEFRSCSSFSLAFFRLSSNSSNFCSSSSFPLFARESSNSSSRTLSDS